MTPSPNWQVRHLGMPEGQSLENAERVLEGLRDGDWDPSDDVRGPGEVDWRQIEDHPHFADAVAEMGPPPPEPVDESRLDMNPMIDVALVLLIFFILTATYTSLRRSIELPPAPTDDGSAAKLPKKEDIQDRVFRVKVNVDTNGATIIKIEDRTVGLENIDAEFKDHVRNTGRKEMHLTVADDVPWGTEAKIYDAARGAEIHQMYWPKGK